MINYLRKDKIIIMGKKLSEMTLEELWQLFPVFLTEHNVSWEKWYVEERAHLSKLLPSYVIFNHIGSTAIDGIWAKPIIDILVEVPKPAFLLEIKNILVSNGYICMSESENRISFNKGYTETGFAKRVFHIHLRVVGDNDEIAFRDYLNAHPDVARKYEELKLSLWKKYEHDRDGYTNEKTEFITRIKYLVPTESIDYNNDLIQKKVKQLKGQSESTIDYIKRAYEFVRDEIPHSMDIQSEIVSRSASDTILNGTGICWTKSCLLAALLRANGIPSGLSYQLLTRADEDDSEGHIIHALNTVFIEDMNKWIRLDARGNKENAQAQFCVDKEMLAFSIREKLGEKDYRDNNPDLDERLVQVLKNSSSVLEIATDFTME